MDSWSLASWFLIIWLHQNVEGQLFEDYKRPYHQLPKIPSENLIRIDRPYSARGLQHQAGSNFAPLAVYDRFDDHFSNGFKNYRISENNDVDRQGQADQTMGKPYDYDDYKASQTSFATGPHQVETIKSEHYHKKSKPYDISSFEHKSHEKHAEVHYHQHKHVHNHEHKQDHVHEHKQDHQHKHLHNQKHKHDHHQEHKHGHEHKHDHHQEHKHEHHQEHKHEHHQEHKHEHHQEHKHDHHQEHKHEHHQEHKHEHHQDHKHSHGHKHEHHQDHKHHHGHKHEHHQTHKHHHGHKHKHSKH